MSIIVPRVFLYCSCLIVKSKRTHLISIKCVFLAKLYLSLESTKICNEQGHLHLVQCIRVYVCSHVPIANNGARTCTITVHNYGRQTHTNTQTHTSTHKHYTNRSVERGYRKFRDRAARTKVLV